MTDAPGAAPAAPEPVSAPAATIEAPVTPPNPVESSGPEKAPEPVVENKPSATVKEAIAKADAKLKEAPKEAKPIEAKPAAKAEVKAEPKARDEAGKFAPKATQDSQSPAPVESKTAPVAEQPTKPTAFHEAPKRFSDDAKAAWQTAPEPVRAEIHRAVKELETGLNQYRETIEPLKPYIQLAQQHNTTIDKALNQYISLERSLKSSDPTQKNAALNDVFQAAGLNPREWAAQILGQTPDQVQSQQDNVIRELRTQIGQLQQQIGGVTQTFQQQREQSTLAEVNKFAEEHPRFEELADDIAFFMKTGRASTLSEAHDLAERLNPAPVKAPVETPVIPAIAADAHTKGSKSISGSPSPGSSPAAKKTPSPSIRGALERAMAQAS